MHVIVPLMGSGLRRVVLASAALEVENRVLPHGCRPLDSQPANLKRAMCSRSLQGSSRWSSPLGLPVLWCQWLTHGDPQATKQLAASAERPSSSQLPGFKLLKKLTRRSLRTQALAPRPARPGPDPQEAPATARQLRPPREQRAAPQTSAGKSLSPRQRAPDCESPGRWPPA